MQSWKTPRQQLECIDNAESVIDDALSVNRYDIAKQAAGVAVVASRRSENPLLEREAADRMKEVAEIDAAYEKSKPAEAVLKQKPDDAAANDVVGRFHCLMKGDWTNGLPRLALGNDASLKGLALLDLALPSRPQEQLELADKWWDWAETQTGRARSEARVHAARWYREAAPNLTGLPKAKAQKRIAATANGTEKLVIPVAANLEWQRAIEVHQGDVVAIKAEGTWCNSVNDRASCTTDADGMPDHPLVDYLIPKSTYGALIGQVGTQKFVVGRAARIQVLQDGILELRINDIGLFDNDGELTVTISVRAKSDASGR